MSAVSRRGAWFAWRPDGTKTALATAPQARSLSLATLESFVYFNPRTTPLVSQVCMRASLDGTAVLVERVEVTALPPDWRDYPAPAALAAIGDAWVAARQSVALRVPSAVTPIEENIVLNPVHPDMARVSTRQPEPFAFANGHRRAVSSDDRQWACRECGSKNERKRTRCGKCNAWNPA